MDPEIKAIILLVQQNFALLNVGLFLSEYIKKNNLSVEAKNIIIPLEDNRFYLNGELIKNLLSDSYVNSNKINVLGYFTEWNAFRGIFVAIYEGAKKNSEFKEYLKRELGEDKYLHFDRIISFCRNVLSHNIDDNIKLTIKDFDKTKENINKYTEIFKKGVVDFKYNYQEDFSNKRLLVNLPKNYNFQITIDFSKMKAGDEFLKKISEYSMFMLSELCYNLAQSYYSDYPS